MSGIQSRYLTRPAVEADLEAIVGFEIEIARVSFADEAITDPALHRKRVSAALGRQGEVTLVAVAADNSAQPLGWAWLSERTNSLTGARYGNFRSLAVAEVADRSLIGELLLAGVLDAAAAAGLDSLTGKVHAGNLGMRALYRKFGFTAAHLTMERRELAADWRGPGGPEPSGSGVSPGDAVSPQASTIGGSGGLPKGTTPRSP